MKRAAIGLTLIGVALAGCRTASESSANGSLTVEWFQMPPVGRITAADTLIPILTIDGDYYTTCLGMEIPLEKSPEGLQWGLMPSPMMGTTIGYFGPSHPCSIHIVDRTRASFDPSYSPEAIPPVLMTKVDKPSGLLKAKAAPPRKLDDFLGLYYPVWYPWVRVEIRKKDGLYYTVEQELASSEPPYGWRQRGRPQIITPLTDGLGFIGNPISPYRIAYDATLNRFEVVRMDNGVKTPLARVSSKKDVVLPPLSIGVPTWR
jgi:hypothetical protein